MRTSPRMVACLFLAIALCTRAQAADDRSASDLLPESVVLYAEVPRPKELLSQIIDHPIYQQLAD